MLTVYLRMIDMFYASQMQGQLLFAAMGSFLEFLTPYL